MKTKPNKKKQKDLVKTIFETAIYGETICKTPQEELMRRVKAIDTFEKIYLHSGDFEVKTLVAIFSMSIFPEQIELRVPFQLYDELISELPIDDVCYLKRHILTALEHISQDTDLEDREDYIIDLNMIRARVDDVLIKTETPLVKLYGLLD